MSWFSKKQPSPAEFTAAVTDGLRGAGFDVLETNEDEFVLKGSFGTLQLAGFFKEYAQGGKAERAEVLRRIVDGAVIARDHGPPDSWEEAAPHLRAVVRSMRFQSQLKLMARAEERADALTTVHQELAPGINLELAYDTERATTSVPAELLGQWGVPLSSAMKTAIDNLRLLDELQFEHMPEGFWVAHARDGYESGRMATPDVFHRLNVSGDPVVIPAVRNGLLVAGSHDERALAAMASTAFDLMEGNSWITFTPYVHDGDRWSRFEVPASHSAHAPLRKLECVELREDYDGQRDLLLRVFGEDVFVPRLILSENDGRVKSFATWGEGVNALLPEAESVVFSLLDPDDPEAYGEMFDVPFSAVLEVVGHRISRILEVEPHRWLTEGFPTEEELEQLRARSEDELSDSTQHH